MANYGGENYTNFKGVNFKNTGFIRVELDGGFNGTVSARASVDASRAWKFPDKSGTFPIMGTFSVQLPALTTAYYSTIATVSGIRAEDALVVMPTNSSDAAHVSYGFDNSTAVILAAAVPGNGNVTLYFNNPGNSTGYIDRYYSYLACR